MPTLSETIKKGELHKREGTPMNRSRNRNSAFDAICSWMQPFVSPVEATKVEHPSGIDFPVRTDPDLLLIRMEALHFDPSQVKAWAPVEFRVLAHVCDYCQCKVRCERDLAYEAAGKIVAWQDYCPNAFRLKAMTVRHAA